MKQIAGTTLMILLTVLALGCSKNSGPDLGDGGPVVTGDGGVVTNIPTISYVAIERATWHYSPSNPHPNREIGVRNMNLYEGGTIKEGTDENGVATAACKMQCTLTKNKSRFVYLTDDGLNLKSAPATNGVPNLGQSAQLNEAGNSIVNNQYFLSPDNSRVLFKQAEAPGSMNIIVMSVPVEGGMAVKYHTSAMTATSSIAWNHDGTKVLVMETVAAASTINFFQYDAWGGGQVALGTLQVAASGEFGGEEVAYSPSGDKIVFAAKKEGNLTLFSMPTSGTTGPDGGIDARTATLGPINCDTATAGQVCIVGSRLYFSANGNEIYFLGMRQSGALIYSDIYKIDSNLNSLRRLTDGTVSFMDFSMNKNRNLVLYSAEPSSRHTDFEIHVSTFNGNNLGTATMITDSKFDEARQARFLE